MTPKQVNNRILEWNSTGDPQPLYQFLGMTSQELDLFRQTEALPQRVLDDRSQNLFLEIIFPILNPEGYSFHTDIKPEHVKEVLEAFLDYQTGKGYEDVDHLEQDIYTIKIHLDLTDDTFQVTHNCGCLGLMMGILLEVLNLMNTEPPCQTPPEI